MATQQDIDTTVALGEPIDGLYGVQHMRMSMSPDITVDMLHYAGTHPVKPFRMTDSQGNIVASLFPKEQISPDDVTTLATVFDLERYKTFTLLPAIYAAVPDLDPDAPIVRGLTLGGKNMVADLVDGAITNLREGVEAPAFVENAGTIEIQMDHLPADAQAKVAAAVQPLDKVQIKAVK